MPDGSRVLKTNKMIQEKIKATGLIVKDWTANEKEKAVLLVKCIQQCFELEEFIIRVENENEKNVIYSGLPVGKALQSIIDELKNL